MITHKTWERTVSYKSGSGAYVLRQEGWFLFGFIPLFIRDLTIREPR